MLDNPNKPEMVTPVTHGTGSDSIIVSRIRRDMSCEKGTNLWAMVDNVRKSAAINAIQIAEELIKSYL